MANTIDKLKAISRNNLDEGFKKVYDELKKMTDNFDADMVEIYDEEVQAFHKQVSEKQPKALGKTPKKSTPKKKPSKKASWQSQVRKIKEEYEITWAKAKKMWDAKRKEQSIKKGKVNAQIKKLEKSAVYKKSKIRNKEGALSTANIDKGKSRDISKDGKQPAINKVRRKSPTYGKPNGAKKPYYYEYRWNRMDVNPRGNPKLAEGGAVEEDMANLELLQDELSNTQSELANQKLLDKDPNSPFILSLERKIEELEEEISYYFAEGGAITKLKTETDYVPNRNIVSVKIHKDGETKTVKGKDIIDGVYLRKISESPKQSPMALSTEIKKLFKEDEYYEKGDEKFVIATDIAKMLEAGASKQQIKDFYIGFSSDGKADMPSTSGIIGMGNDYRKKEIAEFIKVFKENKFEIGLKYPSFNWSSIIKKYKISNKPILKKVISMGNYRYYYQIFKGENIVLSNSYYSERKNDKGQWESYDDKSKWNKISDYNKVTAYQKERDYEAGFNGGYWGIATSDVKVLEYVLKTLQSQKEGYVKDIDIYINGLGGLSIEQLDNLKIQYGAGGILLGSLIGGYVGYKVGRARPQKKGFGTEKKIGKATKQLAKDVKKSLKKDDSTASGYAMAKGGGVKTELKDIREEIAFIESSKDMGGFKSKKAKDLYLADLNNQVADLMADYDNPTGHCEAPSCRKAIYDGSEYCDDDCRYSYAEGGEIDKNKEYKGSVIGFKESGTGRAFHLGDIEIPKNSTPKSIISLAKSKFKRVWFIEVADKNGNYLYEISDDGQSPMVTTYAEGGEMLGSTWTGGFSPSQKEEIAETYRDYYDANDGDISQEDIFEYMESNSEPFPITSYQLEMLYTHGNMSQYANGGSTYAEGGEIPFGWSKKYLDDSNEYKKLSWYIMTGKGAEKTINKSDYIFFEDGSALKYNKQISEWEFTLPKKIDKKSGKGIYAEGGEIHSDMFDPEVHYMVVVNDDYDEPYYFKDFASAKKYTLANVKKQDNTIVSPQGDTIEVEKNQSKKDLDWLFQYSMAKGGQTYAEGGEIKKGDKYVDDLGVEYIIEIVTSKNVIATVDGNKVEFDTASVKDDIANGNWKSSYAEGGEIEKYGSLDNKFKDLDWNDTTEAYYGLDYTPFMSAVEEYYGYNSEDLDKHFKELGWRDTTEAYYGLGYTPFMSTVEEYSEKGSSYAEGGSIKSKWFSGELSFLNW